MKKTVLLTMILALTALTASQAFAGFYGGASIGQSYFTADPTNYDEAYDQAKKIDENATAWKIFAGFNAHKFLGLEASYRDFGKVDGMIADDAFESKTKGFDAAVMGKIQIAVVEVHAKAGLMFWSADGKIADIDWDDDGTDFLWGLGAGVVLGPIGVRLEWETLEADGPDNLSMVSLGATLGF